MEYEDVKSGMPCGDVGKEVGSSEANTFVTIFRPDEISEIHAFPNNRSKVSIIDCVSMLIGSSEQNTDLVCQ